MKSTTAIVLGVLGLATIGLPSAFCQVQNSGPSRIVSVQSLQVIDSTKSASGTQFQGKTLSAVTTAQGTSIPAGTPATMQLQQNAVGGSVTWTLVLISPVAGTQASVGGALNSVTSQVGNLGNLGGLNLPTFGRKKTAQSTTTQGQTPPANNAAGSKVYVAANGQVRFLLNQSGAGTNTSANPAQVSQTPGQGRLAGLTSALNGGPQNPNNAAGTAPGSASVLPPGATPVNGAGNPGTVSPLQPQSSPSLSTQAGSSTVVWGNVQYVLQGCQRQAPHILCQVQLTNLATADATLLTNAASYFVDQAGNKVDLRGATLANCNLLRGCLALSGLPMVGSFEFLDEDSKSTRLIRLQIQTRTGPVQFTNVQVQ